MTREGPTADVPAREALLGAAGPLPAYRIRRSDRARRLRLTVTPEGEVVVVLPRRAPLREAERLVGQHRAWVDRHLALGAAARARLAARPPLAEGRMLHVAGEALRVEERRVGEVLPMQEHMSGHAPARGRVSGHPPARERVGVRLPQRGRVSVEGDRLVVEPGRDGRSVMDLLETWLRRRAHEVIGGCVAVRAAAMGVSPARVVLRDQRSRWGSASARGTISLSWRLVLAPPEVLDAVVVHELAHLVIRDHSASFWALVRHHAPRTTEARRWLRQHGRDLHVALE